MKRLLALVACLFSTGLVLSAARAAEPLDVSSPDGNLTISFSLKENPALRCRPTGVLPRELQGQTILTDSPLGLTLPAPSPLDRDFEVGESGPGIAQHDLGEPLRGETGRARPLQPVDRLVARAAGAAARMDLFSEPTTRAWRSATSCRSRRALKSSLASEDTGFYFAGDVRPSP